MGKSIDPELRNIGAYLKLKGNTKFRIPSYQRAYSWNINRCDKLWQDITAYIDSGVNDPYFFGTIIISCQENDTIFDLIDGQQRTTTFLLLLKALLVRINIEIGRTVGDESESLFRGLKARRRAIMGILYKAEDEDIADTPKIDSDRIIYNSDSIVDNYSINELYKTELYTILSSADYSEAEKKVKHFDRKQKDNRYTNFFKNFKYFYEKASELSGSELNIFTKTFLESCEIIEIKSWQIEQAISMFNSLNSDGLPLDDADIICAKLYEAAERKNIGDDFNALWKELKELADELKSNNIVDINSLLMQQMYYERAKNKYNEIISAADSVNVTTPGLRRFFTEDEKYKSLLNEPVDFCNQLINLANIWKKASEYPVIQVLLKFNDNSKLFLASYFHRFKADEISEEAVTEIAICLLRLFAILELVDIGYSSSLFKTFLFREIVKMADSSKSVQIIKSDFDNHISEKWNTNDIKNDVLDYNKNMLVYLNEYLFAQEKGLSFVLGNKYDIEHIMPQSGANLDAIRKDAQIQNKDEFDDTVNKLGNKILLEEKINRSIGNEWFRTKVSTSLSAKTGYIDSIYPIATDLVKNYENDTKPYWCKQDIEKTTAKASERIVNFIFQSNTQSADC